MADDVNVINSSKRDEILKDINKNKYDTRWKGNSVVYNAGREPLVNYAFMLRVEGVFDLPCKTVKGLQKENEFDYIQEGGVNDYVQMKRKPISRPRTFQVERYVGSDYVDPIALGTELTLPVILFVSMYPFPMLRPARTYVFTGCVVTAKQYGELNAEQSGLVVETTTIAYREMICVDLHTGWLEQSDQWGFDGKSKEGEGQRRYLKSVTNSDWESDNMYSKTNMEKIGSDNMWQFDKEGRQREGNGKRHLTVGGAAHNDIEKAASKETLSENAKRNMWPDKSYARKITDYLAK